jgi:hypothetical protein
MRSGTGAIGSADGEVDGVPRWQVRNYVVTPTGERLLDDLTRQERTELARRIHLALAQALAPEGVEVRVREERAAALGA